MSFGWKTYNSKVYVVPGNDSCLFRINRIALFDLWVMPINSFWNLDATEKKKSRKIGIINWPKEPISSSIFWRSCTKTEVKFEIKEKVKPVFEPKRNNIFSSLEVIMKELERLQKVGVIDKVDYLDWASPTVYLRKKNKIRDCRFFNGPKWLFKRS